MASVNRKVIDSNMLRDPKLQDFLVSSRENYAVLCDYVIMEAYKTENSRQNIIDFFDILSRFPEQTIVLKNTGAICGLNSRGSGIQKRFMCRNQTQEFRSFCKKIKLVQGGLINIDRSIEEHSLAAKKHLNLLEERYKTLPQQFYEIENDFTSKDIDVIRKNLVYPPELVDKIIKTVIEISGYLFGLHPNVEKLPPFEDLQNTYIFRHAVCHYFVCIEWIASGGLRNRNSKKLLNDVVDMNIITYASFFDGLMTNEIKMKKRYKMLKILTQNIL